MNELGGATMGELSCRAGAVSFSSPVLPRSMDGESIVTDFQFSFYNPVARVSEAGRRAGNAGTRGTGFPVGAGGYPINQWFHRELVAT